MVAILNRLADAIVQQSLLVCVVFLLAAGTSWILRSASAHWRYLLWLLVLAKCLTPPMVNLSLPVLLPSTPLTEAPLADVPIEPTVVSQAQGVADESAAAATEIQDDAMTRVAIKARPAHDATRGLPIRAVLAAAWLLGCAAFGMLVAARIWRTHQELKCSRSAADGATLELVAELSRTLGMRTPPEVFTSAAAGQPFVWGWLTGSIYLPTDFQQLGDAPQRRTVLMHELAHVARWDAAMNHAQLFVQAIFFFHPLVWRANREIRKEREKCCDEIVLSSSLASPRQYCEAIVEMMAHAVHGRQAAPALAVAGEVEAVEERIAAMMTPHRRFARRASWAARWAVLAAACVVLPTALVVTSRAESPTEAAADATAAVAAGEGSWKKGQELEVRIVDAETQQPLPGVTLELQNQGEGIDFQDVREFATDANGRAVLQLSDLPPTAVRVYPTKESYVPLRVYWEGAPWAKLPAAITVPLTRATPIGGVVKNEAGEPISGVAVEIHYWATGEGKAPHIRANINAKTTTDEQGRWQIDKMPAEVEQDEVRIWFTHPDYVSDHVRRGYIPTPLYPSSSFQKLFDQKAVTAMRRGDDVRGQVVDETGKPIAGASINVDERYYWWSDEPPRATTDENGEFRIVGIEFKPNERLALHGQSPLYVAVQAAGYAPELIGVDKGGVIPPVTLRRGQTLRGRIVDTQGQPVEGVGVIERQWRGQRNRLGLGMKSNADGRFEITDAPADDIQYDFSKEGYMSVENLALKPGSEETIVTLKAPLKIKGAVIDAETREPIGQFTLLKGIDYGDGRAPEWPNFMTTQMAGGRFETSIDQEEFSWQLRVEAEGYMPAESRAFRPYKPDQGEIAWGVELHKAEPFSGTVLGLKGEPLAAADVYLSTTRTNLDGRKAVYHEGNRVTKTDTSGRFSLPPEVEPFCLVAIHPDGIAMVTEKEFAESTELRLEPWTADNEQLQIIRRPSPGQHVNFPKP
ncbi:carboxypeptidase regulatory-like domain-containing protein [Lacipirellula parvula]|uniref:Peptidase M56 domain-containing protein n=1 Tax=Lacipirellula parvula TaxID=2650471 RepID=A0A5K7X9T1_9BACT|nr:carboxypeptidase regulatory-like domain-containing protein [Lacipirellula parvula]BBO33145.1 hypothetical protein PLANPX_2757 [Lacipirellula parvula]